MWVHKSIIAVAVMWMFSNHFVEAQEVVNKCCRYIHSRYGPPVCGSDNVTYFNEPHMHCINNMKKRDVALVFRGPCSDPCWLSVTDLKIAPVCGSNNYSYPNIHAFECYKKEIDSTITVSHEGRCDCQREVDPKVLREVTPEKLICGTDGATYFNIWAMFTNIKIYNKDIFAKHFGRCLVKCPYSPYFNPVCDKNGKTYANMEAVECRKLLNPYEDIEFAYNGLCCEDYRTDPCKRADDLWGYHPVCASNHITYRNMGEIKCLRKYGSYVTVLHSGGCTVEEVEEEFHRCDACAMLRSVYDWQPVCASDGITYPNAYAFLCARQDNKTLEVTANKECSSAEEDVCEMGEQLPSDPVCGNNGRVYKNQEALRCAKLKDEYLEIRRNGNCTNSDDPCVSNNHLAGEGKPVCGSDNITYATPEALWCARKSNKRLKFKHRGQCLSEEGHMAKPHCEGLAPPMSYPVSCVGKASK